MGTARSVDPLVLDAGLALGLTAWALAEPGTFSDPGRDGRAGGDAGRDRVALARRRWRSWSLEIAGLAILSSRVALAAPQTIALFIAAYSAALYSDRRALVPALLLRPLRPRQPSAFGSLPVSLAGCCRSCCWVSCG